MLRFFFFKCSSVNVVNVTEELQLRICCSVKKLPKVCITQHWSCKPQACLNFILKRGVCLASFLSIFLSFLTFFPFLFLDRKFGVCPGWEPLVSLGSQSDQGNRDAGCTGHQNKCLDVLKSDFLKSQPRLTHFPLAIVDSLCSPLLPPFNLCHFNQVAVKYHSKLLSIVRRIISYMLNERKKKGS